MAVVTRSAHPDLLWPGVHSTFGASYKDKPAYWEKIFTKETSDKHMEVTIGLALYGLAPEKTEGGPISYDEDRQGSKYTFLNRTYGLGYIVTMEELQDGQYAKVSAARATGLARSMRATKETVHANILKRGFNSSYLGGDGATLCSTSHPTKSGNQSNRLATDADLSEASIEDATKIVVNMKDDAGIRVNIMPRGLVVPVNEMFNAVRYVSGALRSGTSNNDPNAIKLLNILPDGVLVHPYLDTDDDAWFMLTDEREGLKSFDRMGIEFDKDEDFGTKNARAAAIMRFVPGWDNFRSIVGTQGAG